MPALLLQPGVGFQVLLDDSRLVRRDVGEVVQSAKQPLVKVIDAKLHDERARRDVLWLGLALLPQNVVPSPPGDLLFEHETRVAPSRDAEDVVEFLQRPLLCFGQEEEDHEEGDHIQTVKIEG